MKAIFLTFFLVPLMMLSQTPEGLIKDMKDGVILVRLMTRENAIKALKEAGQDERAQGIIEQQKEENLKITKAFEENFDFCPVMYFYSSCTDSIRDRELQGYLMNADLDPAPEDDVSAIDKFFISEFGHVESSDEEYFTHYSLESDEEGNKEIRSNYGGDTEIGAAALVIRDAGFKQLQDPFPFHVRTREGLPWERSKDKTVAILNKNLHNYLNKVH
jgi:hypothetical protein